MATRESHHRVHFGIPEDSQCGSDNGHTVVPVRQGIDEVLVNLGFLKSSHKYDVTFQLPLDDYGLGGGGPFAPPAIPVPVENPTPNLYLSLRGFSMLDRGMAEVKVEVTAPRERVMEERLVMGVQGQPNRILQFVFRARVLGKGQGTPYLKNGITCVKVMQDEDSEMSDW